MAPTDQLSQVFAALADPTRREILARLTGGSATVGEVAAPFTMSAPAISQHLGVLEKAGLIARTRRGRWRMLDLRPDRLEDAAAWVDRQRAEWNVRLDALGDHLDTIQQRSTERHDDEQR